MANIGDISRWIESVESTRRELEKSLPRIDFELSLGPVRDLAASIEARMAPISDIVRQHQMLTSAIDHQQFSSTLRDAAEFRHRMLTDQLDAERLMSGLSRLVMSPRFFDSPAPPAPTQLDRIEERVAAIEDTLKAALTPEEPAKEEEDDRRMPGQYL